jgi:hypothetical protein
VKIITQSRARNCRQRERGRDQRKAKDFFESEFHFA